MPCSLDHSLPASLPATRYHTSLESARFSLSVFHPCSLPNLQTMQIPHLAHLGQSRLHTLSLVPEGPHGDAVLPHEAPHSTTITLHAWISEVQWLGGGGGVLATALDPGPPPSQGMALVLSSQVTSFFMRIKKQKVQRQGEGRPDSPRPLQVPGRAIPGWPLLLLEDRTRAPDPGG